MAKTFLADKWGVAAIIYSNQPLLDQAGAIADYLNTLETDVRPRIYTLELKPGDKMWVIANEDLNKSNLHDIYAESWVQQTMMELKNLPKIVREAMPKMHQSNYAESIASDLEIYLGHRASSLARIAKGIAIDAKANSTRWNTSQFADHLRSAKKPDKFIDAVMQQAEIVQRVVAAAFAIN